MPRIRNSGASAPAHISAEEFNAPPSPSVERGGLHASSLLPTKPGIQTLLPASLATLTSPAIVAVQ